MIIILYLVLRYSDTPGIFHSPSFLGGYLLHSYDLNCHPLKSHPMLSSEPIFYLCLKFMSSQRVQTLCHRILPQVRLPDQYPASYSSKKKESHCFPSVCTSHRLSSFVTSKSFINMFLPFLLLLWLLLLKFLQNCSSSYHHLAAQLQKSLTDWLPIIYYPNSSLYCS